MGAGVRLAGVVAVAFSLSVLGCGGGAESGGGSAQSRGDGTSSNFSEALGVGVNMDMVFVKGGTFTMGCTEEQGDECDEDEHPAHNVTVGDFSIGKHEVTQRQWKAIMGENNNPSHFKVDDLPIEQVSWDDVQTFIAVLNSKTGKTYRLPTEAEWEYAARGGVEEQGVHVFWQ